MTSDNEFPTFSKFVVEWAGYEPYVWQATLAGRLYEGWPPKYVDVEPGMGKTAIVDAWLWAFAKQRYEVLSGARRHSDRTVPMRLHFVVDRRVIVDEAHDRALRLQEAIDNADATNKPRLSAVAQALTEHRPSSSNDAVNQAPFDVIRLRGGLPDKAQHTYWPHVPTVITSTIDLFGSRLLFRGYGVSWRRRPIDAALTGCDTLIVVDEAHIARQLLETLRLLERDTGYASRGLDGPLRRYVVAMTATHTAASRDDAQSPDGGTQPDDVLSLDREAEIANNKALKTRFDNRDAVQIEVKGEVTKAQIPKRLTTEALDLRDADYESICVFVNTPQQAEDVTTYLASRVEDKVVMLHGQLDGVRRRLASKALSPLKTRASNRGDSPAFVVATQTLEVGADLDFDAIVTLGCSLDAFVQRARRCNRLGHRSNGRVVVVPESTPSRLYKDTAKNTITLLSECSTMADVLAAYKKAAKRAADEAVTMAAAKAAKRAADEAVARAITRAAKKAAKMAAKTAAKRVADEAAKRAATQVIRQPLRAPRVLDRVVFNDYVATMPQKWEPPVAAWLHDDVDSPTIFVVRRDLSGILPACWQQYAETTKVMPWEDMSMPLYAARDLLEAQGAAEDGSVAIRLRNGRISVLKRITKGCEVEFDPPIGAGDVVIVHSDGVPELLACDPGYEDTSQPLHPGCFVLRPADFDDHADFVALADPGSSKDTVEEVLRSRAQHRLAVLADIKPSDPVAETVRGSSQKLIERVVRALDGDPERLNITPIVVPGTERDGAPEISCVVIAVRAPWHGEPPRDSVPLDVHHAAVGRRAKAWAREIGLRDEDQVLLKAAGTHHDQGKRPPWFQRLLYYPNPPAPGTLLAKSRRPVHRTYREMKEFQRRALRAAGGPIGFRHEAMSVSLLDEGALGQVGPSPLLRHLIGAHHGYGRPLIPPVGHAGAPPWREEHTECGTVRIKGVPLQDLWQARDGEPSRGMLSWSYWPEQFWKLNEDVGPYKLAFLEALLRLADWDCSREDLVSDDYASVEEELLAQAEDEIVAQDAYEEEQVR